MIQTPTGPAKISLIAAVSKNGVIGRKGDLPWHVPEDLKFFKDTTAGSPVIMGRKTCESLDKPLPRRRNIVITRQKGYARSGFEVVETLEQALELAKTEPRPRGEIFIIGGGEIYGLAMPIADRLYLTEIDVTVTDGDAYFPGWPGRLPSDFRCTHREERPAEGETPSFRFLTWDRE